MLGRRADIGAGKMGRYSTKRLNFTINRHAPSRLFVQYTLHLILKDDFCLKFG